MISDLTCLCSHLNIRISAKYGAVEVPDGWPTGTHPYKITLRMRSRALTVPFFMGSANTSEPSAADVLYCLCSDAYSGELSFEHFCSEFGYDLDSRKAEATYKACVKLAPKVRKFLGEHFDTVASAEH